MLSQVEVLSDQGALLILPVGDESNGLYVKDIDGLDPVSASLSSTPFGQLAGEVEQGSRREKRNIVLTAGLEPDYITRTISKMRRELYQYFMPDSKVTFRFVSDDMETVYIRATIEDMDSALFTNDPEAVISAVAYKPDFLSLVETTLSSSTTAGTADNTWVYPGSVQTGFVFRMAINRSISGFTILQTMPNSDQKRLEFQRPMVAGDILELSTLEGNKYATLTRGGTIVSAIGGVSPQATWLQLAPGSNKIRVSLAGAAIPYTIKYVSRYGGL